MEDNLHFRIGNDFGILLTTIAQEHLIYNYNPKKAVETITESLHGCSKELALQIIKGDVILAVDEETQQVLSSKRIPELHDTIFPKIDVIDWYENHSRQIIDNSISLKRDIEEMMQSMHYKKFTIQLSYETVLNYINDKSNNEELIDEIEDNENFIALSTLIKVVKNFIVESNRIQYTMDWIRKSYSKEFEKADIPDWREYHEGLSRVQYTFQKLLNLDYSLIEIDELQSFINSSKEINEIIKKGIEPVDIMDNYSAGWLSPDGIYYALNGEIANMLHNQIANALQEKGLIPMYDNEEEKQLDINTNPDRWLEEHGWVKIHENKIQFEGCNNNKRNIKNVDLTNVQIDIIYKYINVVWAQRMKIGWKEEFISAPRFQMMAKSNLYGLYKSYFHY